MKRLLIFIIIILLIPVAGPSFVDSDDSKYPQEFIDAVKKMTIDSDKKVLVWEYKSGDYGVGFKGKDITGDYEDQIVLDRHGNFLRFITPKPIPERVSKRLEEIGIPRKVVQAPVSSTSSNEIYLPISFIAKPRLQKVLSGHSEAINSVAFSPEGKTLASGSNDNTIKLWDVATGREIKTLKGHSEWVTFVTFSPDDKLLASMSGDKTVKLWDISTGKELQTLSLRDYWGKKVSFSSDGKLLAVNDSKQTIIWDVENNKKLQTFNESCPVAFSPNGRLLARGLLLMDIISGKEIKRLETPKFENIIEPCDYYPKTAAFSPDGKLLAIGGVCHADVSRRLYYVSPVLFDLATGKVLRKMKGSGDFVVFSPDGKLLAAIDNSPGSRTVHLWDVTTGEKITGVEIVTSLKTYESVAFSPNGKVMALGEGDGKISLYDNTNIEIAEFFKKDEFETTDEYIQRIKGAKIPYSTKIKLGKYDADRGVFEIEIEGTKATIPVQRDKAMEISANKEAVYISGNLVYTDIGMLELVDARITLDPTVPKIPVYAKRPSYTPKPIPPQIEEKPVEDIHEIPDFKSSPSPDDIAIVIGIEKYQTLPKSDYSKSDALIVKDYLRALGFQERNIELITDEKATKSSIEKSIEAWLPNRIKKDSRVIVFYSGHGAPEPKTGDAYIVPFDGDPNYLEVTGYPLKRLYDRLGRLQAKEVVVLLDSCFSGAGGRSVIAKGARPLVMMAESSVLPQNMAVLSATQGSQISSSSPEKGHGIFTYYFLKAIKDGKKDIAEIYNYIKPLVEDEAKQLNVQQSPSVSPEPEKLKGRFLLRR
jgi:WD40 repeat protein